jgi:hypothetical protein
MSTRRDILKGLCFKSALRPAYRYNVGMSAVIRSYRIRAYPNGAQRRMLDRWFGASRWLWNTALDIRSAAYRECGLKLTGTDFSRWLTVWRAAGAAIRPAWCFSKN